MSPQAYTALQKVAYPAIKTVDPTATVLSAPVVGRYAGAELGYTFLRRAYQAGIEGLRRCHRLDRIPGRGARIVLARSEGGVPAGNTLPAQLYLRDLIDEYDPGRKVWIMELGWSTCVSCNVSAANGATEAQQADYLTRAFIYRRRYLTGITEQDLLVPAPRRRHEPRRLVPEPGRRARRPLAEAGSGGLPGTRR